MKGQLLLDRITHYAPSIASAQFLVSGSDDRVRKGVLHDVAAGCRAQGKMLIVVDDTGGTEGVDVLRSAGYRIKNGMSGECCLYNPLVMTSVQGMSKLRQLLSVLEYSEKQKGKLMTYLQLVQHVERLANGDRTQPLTIDKLSEYCTTLAVRQKLQRLVDAHRIDQAQHMTLLAKYAECCSAAADFEDLFFILMPFIRGSKCRLDLQAGQALVFPTGQLGEDETLRRVVMQLLLFGVEELGGTNLTVLVLDRGYGSRTGICQLIRSLPPQVQIHLFSQDIFTLCDASALAMMLNRFTARIYSRHLSMSSAEAVEKACGEIDVVQNSYSVTYDRHWRANTPWDILMGNNKTEAYTQNAPVREPRYRKEMIVSFAPGQGIWEYMGNASLFSI